MKMKLIIVGNGFDCAQRFAIKSMNERFDTSYTNFGNFLRKKDSALVNLLDTICEEYSTDDPQYWYQFEERLGKPDLANLQDDLELEQDFIKKMHDDYDDDSVTETVEWTQVDGFLKIKYYFCKWLQARENGLKFLLESKLVNKLSIMDTFSEEDIFLNFNYTRTIELVYDLSYVFHIHGDIEECKYISESSNNPDIILGHKYKKYKFGRINYDSVVKSLSKIEKKYAEIFDKNCEDIIDEDKTCFFSVLNDKKGEIDEIYVLGHSIEDVDIDYFRKIIEILGDKQKWYISDYNNDFVDKKSRLLRVNPNLKVDKCVIK